MASNENDPLYVFSVTHQDPTTHIPLTEEGEEIPPEYRGVMNLTGLKTDVEHNHNETNGYIIANWTHPKSLRSYMISKVDTNSDVGRKSAAQIESGELAETSIEHDYCKASDGKNNVHMYMPNRVAYTQKGLRKDCIIFHHIRESKLKKKPAEQGKTLDGDLSPDHNTSKTKNEVYTKNETTRISASLSKSVVDQKEKNQTIDSTQEEALQSQNSLKKNQNFLFTPISSASNNMSSSEKKETTTPTPVVTNTTPPQPEKAKESESNPSQPSTTQQQKVTTPSQQTIAEQQEEVKFDKQKLLAEDDKNKLVDLTEMLYNQVQQQRIQLAEINKKKLEEGKAFAEKAFNDFVTFLKERDVSEEQISEVTKNFNTTMSHAKTAEEMMDQGRLWLVNVKASQAAANRVRNTSAGGAIFLHPSSNAGLPQQKAVPSETPSIPSNNARAPAHVTGSSYLDKLVAMTAKQSLNPVSEPRIWPTAQQLPLYQAPQPVFNAPKQDAPQLNQNGKRPLSTVEDVQENIKKRLTGLTNRLNKTPVTVPLKD